MQKHSFVLEHCFQESAYKIELVLCNERNISTYPSIIKEYNKISYPKVSYIIFILGLLKEHYHVKSKHSHTKPKIPQQQLITGKVYNNTHIY